MLLVINEENLERGFKIIDENLQILENNGKDKL